MFRRLFTIAAVALGLAAAAPLPAQQPVAPRPQRQWVRPDVTQHPGARRRRLRRHRRRMMARRMAFRRMRMQRAWRGPAFRRL